MLAEQRAAGIFEHEHGPAALAHELERPRRPRFLQLVLDREFVAQALEANGHPVAPRPGGGPARLVAAVAVLA
jgi:hypothetical protein